MISSNAIRGRAVTRALVVLSAIVLGISLTPTARAVQATPPRTAPEATYNLNRETRVATLRQALDEQSQRAIYRWHDAEHPSPPTWFDKLLSKIGRSLDREWNRLRSFFRRLWPRGLNLPIGNEKSSSRQLKDLRLWLILIAIMTVTAGGMLIWLRRRREATSLSISVTVPSIPDLSDTAAASERSEDEWFELASRLEDEGDLRSALRAAYFALLAGLAQREWLSIRRDRTNREYLNEFTRRWRRRPQASIESRAEIPEKLRSSLRQFDLVWYGFHVVTPIAVAAYRQDQREFLSHV